MSHHAVAGCRWIAKSQIGASIAAGMPVLYLSIAAEGSFWPAWADALVAVKVRKRPRLSSLSAAANSSSTPPTLPTLGPAPALRPGLLRWALPVTLAVQSASAASVIAPAVAAPALLAALGLGTAAVGVYIAIVYLGAMAASLWGAALVQRWGPIRVSQAGLALSAMGLGLMAVPQVAAAALGASLLGLGYGPITPASSQMLARTTPPERYGLVF